MINCLLIKIITINNTFNLSRQNTKTLVIEMQFVISKSKALGLEFLEQSTSVQLFSNHKFPSKFLTF